MMSDPEQSNELSMFDGDDGSTPLDLMFLLKILGGTDCTIRVFQLFNVWINTVVHLKSTELL